MAGRSREDWCIRHGTHAHKPLLVAAAFQQIWAAAEAADSAERNIKIEYKINGPKSFSVTNVTLIEAERIHPVVAELRLMREKLMAATTLVWVVAAFVVILGVVRLVRWFLS